jgi:hypothetical protein
MQELCFSLLTGEFAIALHKRCVQAGATIPAIVVNRSHFIEVYERSLLTMDAMTPHQKEKYDECVGPGDECLHGDVILRGPAGSGKTYVGTHLMHQALTSDDSAHVLFMVQNMAFAYFIAKWVLTRISVRAGFRK